MRSHGDFSPWNLKIGADGRIRAVDWEQSTTNELPYLDLHHFRRAVQHTLGRECAPPWEVFTAALRRVDPGLSPETALTARIAAGLRHLFTHELPREHRVGLGDDD